MDKPCVECGEPMRGIQDYRARTNCIWCPETDVSQITRSAILEIEEVEKDD